MNIFKKKNKNNDLVIPINNWLHYSPSSDSVVVFVHGFLSNTKKCWTGNDVFWPNLLLEDTRVVSQDHSIYLAEYYTEITSGNYSVTDCSKQIFSNLNLIDTVHNTNVISKNNIIFVCHSLGGIIIRHMIDFNYEQFANKKIGLLLMGSPSLGSKLADSYLIKKIRGVYKNTTADQLALTNFFLDDLDHRFRKLISQQDICKIVGIEAIENHSVFRMKFLPDFFSLVVSPISANRYFESQTIANSDHISIVKPDSLQHQSHTLLVNFLTKEFGDIKSRLPIKQVERDSLDCERRKTGDVLFDVLNQRSIQYFLSRPVDENVEKEHTNRSIWIHGCSGSGKTTTIKNYLLKNNLHVINLCLSHLKGAFNSESLYEEILLSAKQIGQFNGDFPQYMPRQTLISFLSYQTSLSDVVLYLDEIPFTSDSKEMKEFVACISEIINSVNLQVADSKIRIFFSSIESPKAAMQSCHKCSEQISPIEFTKWRNEEILSLIELITNNLPHLILNPSEQQELVFKASGSPRAVKNFFRNKSNNSKLTFAELLITANNYEHAY